MKDVVIVSACRTAIGKYGGAFKDVPAVDLGAVVIEEAIKRAGIAKDAVDEVVMGNVLQSGLGQNPARQAMIKAGMPVETPAMTINKVCGSGLRCVSLAAQIIKAGDADVIVAGGMENMSQAPYLVQKARWGYRMGDGKLVDEMIKDGLWDAFNNYHMGITAENVAEKQLKLLNPVHSKIKSFLSLFTAKRATSLSTRMNSRVKALRLKAWAN